MLQQDKTGFLQVPDIGVFVQVLLGVLYVSQVSNLVIEHTTFLSSRNCQVLCSPKTLLIHLFTCRREAVGLAERCV